MASNQLELPAHHTNEQTHALDKTTPASLATEQLQKALHDQQALGQHVSAGHNTNRANTALEAKGVLPSATLVGDATTSDRPAPAAKPADMANDAARIHNGLSELHDWTGRSNHNIEKDLRDTVATMNSTQISALDKEYRTLYGKGLQESITADNKLSDESKAALNIYLKGADQRRPADTLALADLGTKAENLDMFEEAFRDASPEARSQYLAQGGKDKVKDAFGGIFSDADVRHAMDYVNGGRLSLQTQIGDNTGIFSSNKEAIEHSLSRMTLEQKAQYSRGSDLSNTVPEYVAMGRGSRPNTEGFNRLTAEQKADLTYYRQVHHALDSAGNKTDLAKWDGEIKGTSSSADAATKSNNGAKVEVDHPRASNTIEGAREAFNQSRDKEYKSNDGIGRSVVRNLWDGTSDMSTDELNQYAADMSRAAAANATLSAERQQAHQQNLEHSLDMLKESKSAAADAVVDGTLLVAGVGGAAFTGGASLALVGAVSAGGAAVKIGTKAAIVGDDYNFTAGQVLADGATGAINAATMFVGPAQIAKVAGLGGKTALAAGERAVFSYGTDVALNAAAGAAGGVASGTVEGVTKWDTKKSVSENLAQVGETALVRGATSAVLAGVVSGTIGGVTRLARAEAHVAPTPSALERPVAGERPALTERPAINERPAISEKPAVAEAPAVSESPRTHDIDGRPLSETQPRREIIETKFAPVAAADKAALREALKKELGEVKAIGIHGKPTSAYQSLMQDTSMSAEQKETVLLNLGLVREHLASYRLGDRMHPDPEVNWIHTQGEIAKVLQAGRAKGLNATDMEDSLLASMYSDSVKFSAPAPEGTAPNFHTHHLDGALAADHSLRLQGFPQDRTDRIVEAILAHQVAPPKFMGQLYQMKIAGTLEGMIKEGKLSAAEGQHMRDVLAGMTEVGPDGIKRIRQLANVNEAPRVTGADGLQQVAFSADEQKVFALSGTDRWVTPYDPTFDPKFNSLSAVEREAQLSRRRIAQNLIDGDAADNYSTTGGVSKIVAIRGPETFFSDATVWDSIASVNTSFKDAYTVLSAEGQRVADSSLSALNQVTDRSQGSLKTHMDGWLKARGLDPTKTEIPFYNAPLTYVKPGEVATEAQTNALTLAREIRSEVVDFMRRDHRTDKSLPGTFDAVRGTGH